MTRPGLIYARVTHQMAVAHKLGYGARSALWEAVMWQCAISPCVQSRIDADVIARRYANNLNL
jgi:hypothetical protein